MDSAYTKRLDTISKVTIGKTILQLCGNEGSNGEKESLRRLLQAVITHITNEKPTVWEHASIEIYDNDFNQYNIISGKGNNTFLASYDERGFPTVVRVHNNRGILYRMCQFVKKSLPFVSNRTVNSSDNIVTKTLYLDYPEWKEDDIIT